MTITHRKVTGAAADPTAIVDGPAWDDTHVDDGIFLTPIRIGNSSVSNSVDQQVLVSRSVDDTVTGNGHAFSDSSNVDRSGSIGYNSFDFRITVTGSNNYNHFAGFQLGPTVGTSGTTDNVYGWVGIPTVNTGTVTNLYHGKVFDTTGTGTVTTQYGLYVANLTKGGTNWGVYVDGTTPSSFGGAVTFGTSAIFNGSSSGAITVKAAAVASGTITLPAGTTDFSATGGTSKFVKQASAGAALTVVQPAFTDISGSVAASQMPALTGDVTTSAGGVATAISANAVTRAMQAQGVARSVIGVTGNATANVADIQGTADQVLRVNGAGTAVAFGAIDLTKSAAATMAWTAYSPTVTSTGGTITTVTLGSCSNMTLGGGILYVQFDFTITTVGTGSGFFDITVPTYTSAITGSANEVNTGAGLAGPTTNTTTTVRWKLYNNGATVGANFRWIGGMTLRV